MTLPSDLERLGNHLEVAALRAVRRRARRRTLLNALCVLAMTAPLAIAVSTSGERPAKRSAPPGAEPSGTFALWAPARAADIAVHRIPDIWFVPVPAPACIDGNDCRRPVPPTRLMNYPDPARRA
jgi:hypothetical protein